MNAFTQAADTFCVSSGQAGSRQSFLQPAAAKILQFKCKFKQIEAKKLPRFYPQFTHGRLFGVISTI
jgi:hypothetical protein